MANTDTRSRKWQLTINNPSDFGWSHDRIKFVIDDMRAVLYYCLCDEIGANGTFHTHVFIAFTNAVRFSTLKNSFSSFHFEVANGTSQQNRDYIAKEGKWENDKKHETNISDSFEEFGELPIERQGQRNDIRDLYDMIKQGMSNYEILEMSPEYMMKIEKIERARQIVRDESFKNEFRKLEVTYCYGKTDSGKTRGIMDQYGYSNVYRVTDYTHPFDGYDGQDIIIFEEFRSSLKIQDMLNYLDGYPLTLPARFSNRVACFTKVYLTTNIDLESQYLETQKKYSETWDAFVRRIHKVKVFDYGKIEEYSIEDYLKKDKGFYNVPEQIDLPFNN